MRFKDKVVLITGAGKGIGQAAAEEFAREGAIVIGADIDKSAIEAVATAVKATGGRMEARVHDVTNEAGWRSLVAGIIEAHGRLDILVNNAGIGLLADVEQSTAEIWRRTMAVNLESVFFGTQAAIGEMKVKGGVIVNVASIASDVGEPMLAAYNASKGGVKTFTKATAIHCARHNYPIRIVSLHPGYCNTSLMQGSLAALPPEAGEAMIGEILKSIPLGRLSDPREVARPLLFLASDDASYITGSSLVVDGGYTAV